MASLPLLFPAVLPGVPVVQGCLSQQGCILWGSAWWVEGGTQYSQGFPSSLCPSEGAAQPMGPWGVECLAGPAG